MSIMSQLPNHLIMDIIKIHTTQQRQQRVEDLIEFKSKFGNVISVMDEIFDDYLESGTPCNYLWSPGEFDDYLVWGNWSENWVKL